MNNLISQTNLHLRKLYSLEQQLIAAVLPVKPARPEDSTEVFLMIESAVTGPGSQTQGEEPDCV